MIAAVAAAGLLAGSATGATPAPSTAVAAELVSAAVAAAPAAPVPAASPAAPAKPAAAAKPAAPAKKAAAPKPAAKPAAKPAPAKPAPAKPAAVPGLVKGTPCTSAARACIDLSANRAWLIRNGVVQLGPVPITHGRAGWRTPPGNFRVTFKNANHRSSIFDNAPMPYSVFFNGGIAFHQGSLSVKSHGCIHLSRSAARTFFASLSRGDVVQVRR
jgi:lipoprotein-anchoring transpeptidase ErfK/SrfK